MLSTGGMQAVQGKSGGTGTGPEEVDGDRPGEGITQAVVLAAGRGSRLGNGIPKPLFPLLGLSLLERTLLTLQKAGITRACVVLGYRGDEIRRAVEEADRVDLELSWIHNEDWEKPNGLSVLAAEPMVDGPFILTMADHVFTPGFVSRLGDGARTLRGLDLVVDRNVEGIFDLDDATKVRVDSGRITDIGKGLDEYEAIDTGVFLASPRLFDAIRTSAGQGDASLSGGVRILASEGRARAVEGGDLPWKDVDSPADVPIAEACLISTLTKETDGIISRHLNRHVSGAISRRLVRTGVTPNQMSVFALLVSLVAAGFAAVGGYWAWLAAGLFFQTASILDGVDGELANLKFQASVGGQWLDTVCDNISYLAFLGAVVVGVYRAGFPEIYVWAGLIGTAATLLSLGNVNLYLLREKGSGSQLSVDYEFRTGSGVLHRVLREMSFMGKRDFLAFLVMVLALLGHMPLALLLFGAGSALLLLPVTVQANVSSWLASREEMSPQVS